jgi:hypothetical protein
MDKKKIRPLYSEFQGYLSQAPTPQKPKDSLNDNSIWDQYNNSVKLLSEVTKKDYSRFLIEPLKSQYSTFILVNTYRQKLGGLISNLHGDFFSDEQPPFSGMPRTIISQTQEQAQSTHVKVYFDIQDKIDRALQGVEDGTKEASFLETFKSALREASDVNEIFKLCFQLAKDYGIGIATLLKFFS